MRENLNDMKIEIPARLGGVVDESLRQVGKIHRRNVAKRACAVCGSLFAVFGAFLIFGFSNPALASQIPLLGKLFQQVNTDSKQYGPANLEGYGVVQELNVPAEAQNTDATLLLTGTYSDGDSVWVGMELILPEEMEGRYRWVSTQYAKECSASVNGELSPAVAVEGFDLHEGILAAVMSLDVPEGQREAENLRVSLEVKGLLGRLTEEAAGNDATDEPLDWIFAADFSVKADRGGETLSFPCEAEDNGAKVSAVSVSPTQTVISVEKPYWGEVGDRPVLDAPDSYPKGFPQLLTEDGEEINIDTEKTYVQKGENRDHGNYDMYCREPQKADLYFDAPPAGARRLVLRFREGESENVMAEFVIDLENRTVVPGAR